MFSPTLLYEMLRDRIEFDTVEFDDEEFGMRLSSEYAMFEDESVYRELFIKQNEGIS